MTIDDLASQITIADVETAEKEIIALLLSIYPQLDLRIGTVLRDLLIRPLATLYAINKKQIGHYEKNASLSTIISQLEQGAAVDKESINRLLSNFGISLPEGKHAVGKLFVRVQENMEYLIPEDIKFTTAAGLSFKPRTSVIVSSSPAGAEQIQLFPAKDGTYYFILDVIAEQPGSKYNLPEGVVFFCDLTSINFLEITSYSPFVGGEDSADLLDFIKNFKSILSYRSFDNFISISSLLKENFKNIYAVSVQGYGDPGQFRDKNNIFSLATGGKVDIYIRDFFAPNTVILHKRGVKIDNFTYKIEISEDDAPGFYAIKTISEVESSITSDVANTDLQLITIGSYPFTETRACTLAIPPQKSINPLNPVEYVNTIYQKATIVVTDVPFSDAERLFKIVLYTSPTIKQLQQYCDTPTVKPVNADILIKMPYICMVGVNAVIYLNPGANISKEELKLKIYNYVNQKSFIRKLTRSELVNALYLPGVARFDLSPTGFQIFGQIRDCYGQLHMLSGDSLDITSISNKTVGILPQTCVFATELDRIYLNLQFDYK